MALGEILRELLEEKGITQKELAKSLNIGSSTLGNYIQNTREPDYAILKDFADYFGVSTDYLLDHRHSQLASRQEDVLLHIFRALTLDEQELFLEMGRAFFAHKNKRGAKAGRETGK